MTKNLFRSFVAVLLALIAIPAAAQTALNTTTLAAAITTDSQQDISLTSATNVAAGDWIFIDRELMRIQTLSGVLARVVRGQQGTMATTHWTTNTLYTGVPERFYHYDVAGSCIRANELFLPHISVPSGNVADCTVGTTAAPGQWVYLSGGGAKGSLMTVRSEAFNLDNGAGTTVDAVLIRHPRAIYISACRIVYEDATSGTVAGGNAAVGVTVGGAEIVAATAYTNATAVGGTTAMVVLPAGADVAAATPVLVRHTGVAAVQAGEAVVECDYQVN